MTRCGLVGAALLAAAGSLGAAPLHWVPEKDYGPFVYEGPDGRPQGLSVDLLQAVQQRAGLALEPLPARPLGELLAQLRRGDADLATSLRPTPERAQFLAFSVPYVSVPAIVVMRAGQARAQGNELLRSMAGRPVAVGAGYAVEGVVRAAHPGVSWQAVSDDDVALKGVAEGRYDAAVVDAASAAWVIRRRGLQGLAASGEIGFNYELSFAVRRERADLLDRIDAAIRAMTPAERERVLDRWLLPLDSGSLAPHAEQATHAGWVLMGMAALAAAALLIGRWRRLRA